MVSTSHFKNGKVTEKDFDTLKCPSMLGITIGSGQFRSIQTFTDSDIAPKDTENVYRSMSDRDRTLFVYGNIWYNDVFGDSHWVQYCVGYSKAGNSFFYDPDFNRCDNYEKEKTKNQAPSQKPH
jgi:hypothetical protein